MKKLGLSILYTDIGKEKTEWKHIKDRDKNSYLREQYWVNRATNREKGMAHIYSSIGRQNIGAPGDIFNYQMSFGSDRKKGSLTWLEIVEVFAYDNGKKIKKAMKEWNDIEDLEKKNLKQLVNTVDMGRPSEHKQRYVANKVFDSIDTKVKKTSYNTMVNSFGKGHLIVGLPLWFATPPIQTMKTNYVPDNFITRVQSGLLKIKKKILKKGECPFFKITVIWDLSIRAMEEWLEKSSLNQYKVVGQSSLLQEAEDFIKILRLVENNMKEEDNPSAPMHISINLGKKEQPNNWQKNLKVISQNSDAKLVLALEEKFWKI